MLNKYRTKLSKHYYRNKGKRYYFKDNKYLDLQQLRIFCKSNIKKDNFHYWNSIHISLLSYKKRNFYKDMYFNKNRYIKHGLNH